MRLQVLGCHGGEVLGSRLPALLVNDRLLLEAGSVTAALPIEEQTKIRHVLLSHAHLDHVAGLPFLVDNLAIYGRPDPVITASLAPVIDTLRRHCFNKQLWPDFTTLPDPDAPILQLQALEDEVEVEFEGLRVIPVPVDHTVPAAGFIIHDGTDGFVFSGDTGPTRRLWEAARKVGGIRAVVVETAFPDRLAELARVSGHLTPRLLQREREKMPDAPLWIYHLKPIVHDETVEELSRLDGEIHILQQDRTYTL